MNAFRNPGLWADRLRVVVWAAMVLFVVAPHIVGFTTDSDAYLDVAANVAAGRGLVQTVVDFWRPAIPDPLGMWPPVYPLAVALATSAGVPLLIAGRLVAALGFVAFALAFHALALRAGGRGFAFVTTFVVLLGPGLAQAGATAWSESLYLFLLTLGLVGVADLAGWRPASPDPSRPVPDLGPGRAFLYGLALGFAADTRYVGLASVPVALVLLLGARVRGPRLWAWLAGVTLPIAAWLGHNLAAFGRPFGPGLPQGHAGLLEGLRGLASSARWEFLPSSFAHLPWIAIPALAGTLIALVWAIVRGGVPRLAAATALAQLGLILFAVWQAGINDVQGRFTLVAWPFVGLALCAAVDAALAHAFGRTRSATLARFAVSGLALIIVGAGLGRFLGTHSMPPGQTVARRHAQVAFLQQVRVKDAPILTDSGHLLRLTTGCAAVQVPPPHYRVREFTAEDEKRWRAQGVREALFRSDSRAMLGAYLAARTGGGAEGWAIEDSSAGYVRYRIAP